MKTAPRTANNAVVTRLPAMPGIPYEVKNCITSWPDAKPEPDKGADECSRELEYLCWPDMSSVLL